jgi:hypothetical protein
MHGDVILPYKVRITGTDVLIANDRAPVTMRGSQFNVQYSIPASARIATVIVLVLAFESALPHVPK